MPVRSLERRRSPVTRRPRLTRFRTLPCDAPVIAAERGAHLGKALADVDGVASVRGQGLLRCCVSAQNGQVAPCAGTEPGARLAA